MPAPSADDSNATAVLTATWKTENEQLATYQASITIANPGNVPITDWTIVILLPLLDLTVRNLDGAVMSRTDRRVVFTPIDSTRTVQAASSMRLQFQVDGLSPVREPVTCTIDGRACAGVPG